MSGVIVVTGAFGALGRALVPLLVRKGFRVAALDLAPAVATGADLTIEQIDLTDAKAVEQALGVVASQLDAPCGLANVAGGFVWRPLLGGAIGDWEAMFQANLMSAVTASRAVLPFLVETGGAIVNVGAAAASNPGTGMAPYAASKAGVMALTKSLAEEVRGRGVRVNAVLPTILDTPTNRSDMPDADPASWVKPEAAAKVIAFLLSEDAACVTGAGVELSVG
jgi:NAD(P)-dependent dehydrogenase (short-subunit alcohol dehydrogenase family)